MGDGPRGSLRFLLSQFQRYEVEGAGEDHGGVRFVQTRLTRRQVLQIALGVAKTICERLALRKVEDSDKTMESTSITGATQSLEW